MSKAEPPRRSPNLTPAPRDVALAARVTALELALAQVTADLRDVAARFAGAHAGTRQVQAALQRVAAGQERLAALLTAQAPQL